tara:strand:- start:479 stop:982 length:504 start_codon:yes stop_codon:yes gene_type:complete
MSDIEMTGINEEEEVALDDITEGTTLMNDNVKKVSGVDWRKLCCKVLLILVAVIIFLAILIRSWSDYGVYITKHVFPPMIHSISTQCYRNDTMVGGYQQNFFNAPTCDWDHENNYTLLKCSLEKPYYGWYLQTSHRGHITNMTWNDQLVLNYSTYFEKCVELVIWSI